MKVRRRNGEAGADMRAHDRTAVRRSRLGTAFTMVLALLAPVAALIGGSVPLPSAALASSGTGPSPAFQSQEVWDGGNLTEACPMCISANLGSMVSPPSTDPSKTVNPATGDLSESYTLAAIPDPGGGELNLTLTYDAESAASQFGANWAPQPWGYGWSDNWDAQVSDLRK